MRLTPTPIVAKEMTSSVQANHQSKANLKIPVTYCFGKIREFEVITVEDQFDVKPALYLHILLLLR